MQGQIKTIAISRQRGSGGSYVGREVAERLGLRYIDREMLRHAAEYLVAQDTKGAVETAESSWWSRLEVALAMCDPLAGYVPPLPEAVYEGELFGVENRLLREIADQYEAVIVGRGAAQALRGHAGVLSVFLHAPDEWRMARVQKVYSLADQRAAQQMVRDSDRDRARFVEATGEGAWTDVRLYDLSVNTAALGLDASIELIVRAVGSRPEGEGTKR